ncbi:MAG: FIST signal transduction protein [Pseudomonadales bacterium]
MKVTMRTWSPATGWQGEPGATDSALVLIFGGVGSTNLQPPVAALRSAYPNAQIAGCTTAGQIINTEVTDEHLVAAVIHLEHSRVQTATVTIKDHACGQSVGQTLAKQLPVDELRHVLVFSDGLQINGSDLANGMASQLPDGVPMTGGLAADGSDFGTTQVICNDQIGPGIVCCIGFYGDRLSTGYGSLGGWDVFGPDRVITRSSGNVLYELDGKCALDIYKDYLGEYAKDLPGSGLLFPLNIETAAGNERVVRTILGVSEDEQSMTFAGDIPEGARAQLMRANFDRLIDGATGAAKVCQEQTAGAEPWEFGLLISCVGRRMVLKQRVEEELEGVEEILGQNTPLAGFYSYGELAPFHRGDSCRLHNQTMTITTFSEAERA